MAKKTDTASAEVIAAKQRIADAIAALERRLEATGIDAEVQGRLYRLQRHASRLDAMGDAYLPTLDQELPPAPSAA